MQTRSRHGIVYFVVVDLTFGYTPYVIISCSHGISLLLLSLQVFDHNDKGV